MITRLRNWFLNNINPPIRIRKRRHFDELSRELSQRGEIPMAAIVTDQDGTRYYVNGERCLPPATFNGTIDNVSVRDVETGEELLVTPTDAELEAWRNPTPELERYNETLNDYVRSAALMLGVPPECWQEPDDAHD